MKDLCNRSNWCNWSQTKVDGVSSDLTVSSLGWAVTRDVSSLTALVASFASSVERSTIRSSAVSGDMTELATGVAFHCLGLAISGKVIWPTALVAGCRARSTSKATTRSKSTTESTTRGTNTTASTWNRAWASWAWACASQMSWEAAVVASATGSSPTETKSWAVSLNVA